MELPIYQVDAFAEKPFEGNPAAIVPLTSWLPEEAMLAIAAENNLAETAFFVPLQDGTGPEGADAAGGRYHLRWFTPTVEVDLCGHATLASAHVLFTHLAPSLNEVRFETRSGELTVTREESGRLQMDFPARPMKPAAAPEGLAEALGTRPLGVLKGVNLMALFDRAEDVAALRPDVLKLTRLCGPLNVGLIASAPGQEGSGIDYVSRFFAPAHGINEDPVTGSAHCDSGPYWAKRLGKDALVARQISKRGGTVHLRIKGERVELAGTCADFMQGTIHI